MSTGTLASRRSRLVERIAVGRMDFIDDLDVLLEPLRRIDRIGAAWERVRGQTRGYLPMLYPLAPLAVLGLVRGRHHVGSSMALVLRAAIRSVAFARVVRQLSPFLAQMSARARTRAQRPE